MYRPANSSAWIFGHAEIVLAGLIGACGVVAAALASHSLDDRLMSSVALICLTHAPILAMLGLARGTMRHTRLVAIILASGIIMFSVDLAMRAISGERLFVTAAPAAGLLLIVGWLGLSVIALMNLLRGRTS